MSDQLVGPRGFIVGMSRSGTKWLSMCLNQHPDVAVFGETGFWGKSYVPPDDGLWSPSACNLVLEHMPVVNRSFVDESGVLRIEGQSTAVGADVGGLRPMFRPLAERIRSEGRSMTPADLFSLVCTEVSRQTGKNIIVEKTPHHINWIRRIRAAYGDSRFIVMYREPYEFMRSYKHQGDRKEGGVGQMYQKMYHPVGCALVYRGYARAILEAQSLCPEDALLVPLQSIKDDARGSLEQVCRFLDVPFAEECLLPPVNSSFPGQKKDLEEVDVLWMNLIAGREIRMLGYETRESHPAVLEVLKSIVSIPGWGWDVWKHLSRKHNAPVGRYLMRWLR